MLIIVYNIQVLLPHSSRLSGKFSEYFQYSISRVHSEGHIELQFNEHNTRRELFYNCQEIGDVTGR